MGCSCKFKCTSITLIVQVQFSCSRKIIACLHLTILFVHFWSCCCRDLWTNCLNNLLYALSYTWNLHLWSPAQTLPCWNLNRKVMPKLNLTCCCWLLCSEWPDQSSFPLRPKLRLIRTYTWDGFDKCKMYVKMMIKITPWISMILNKQKKIIWQEKCPVAHFGW